MVRTPGTKKASGTEAVSGEEFTVDPDAEQEVDNPEPVVSEAVRPTAKRQPRQTRKTPSGTEEDKMFERSGDAVKLRQAAQNLGWLGKFFGASTSAPTNIAGVLILISIFALIVTCFVPSTTPADATRLADAQKVLTTILTTAVGFLFGTAVKK